MQVMAYTLPVTYYILRELSVCNDTRLSFVAKLAFSFNIFPRREILKVLANRRIAL